ncbi:ferrochelatase [Candidatus Binatia bacterium]|nr:ferrochelatase [Candidatus Binatia bacterium]
MNRQPPAAAFDAVLLIAFGGPTCMDDVRPFIANVLGGRPVPPERLESVVGHYALIGGRSPLNDLTFRQADALAAALRTDGLALPVYVGMRNWNPYLRETLARMAGDGIRRAVGIILSPLQCDASWARYMRDAAAARHEVGDAAPQLDYAAGWNTHPLFVEAMADNLSRTLEAVPAARVAAAAVVFTAHSIPVSMAASAPYAAQFEETAALVARHAGVSRWSLAYQSRSGNPRDPWLEPDILGVVRAQASAGVRDVVVVPIGFVCDHVEVLYDLDIEARQAAAAAAVGFHRVPAVNAHPAFVRMLVDLVRRTTAAADASTAPGSET